MDVFHNSPYSITYRHRYNKNGIVPDQTKSAALKESLKVVFKQYCAESSICGLKHLVDKNNTLIEKIIWMVTLIMGLICSTSLVWITFTKYYSAPLVTTQMPDGVPVSKIIFPAVGICSHNRISKHAVMQLAKKLTKAERNAKYNEEQVVSYLVDLGRLYDYELTKGTVSSDSILHNILGDYDVNDLMQSLTPTCRDLLVTCAWNSEPKDCLELFDFRLTINGYCCTFNYLRAYDSKFTDKNSETRNINMYNFGNKSNFDYDQGLKVLLRINETDDFYYNIPMLGAQLQFSDSYDFPDAPSGSFAMQIINPDVQMTVMIAPSFTEASRDIQHVHLKLRQCRFYDESTYLPFYTYSDCMLKCRMTFLLDKCNCTPFNIPKMPNSRTCDMRDVPCLRKYYAQSTTVRPDVDEVPPELELDMVNGGIPCPMCYPTCSKTAYSYDFNNVIIYPEHLNAIPDNDRENWLRGANFSGTSIVHVKYAREVAECYGQNVIMKWFDLISNIGSTCGFVTGFSFVSVLEFIYFFTIKLIRELDRRKLQENLTARVNVEHHSRYFQPIMRYPPLYWNEITGATRYKQHMSFD